MPRNKLSERERQKILQVVTSSDYQDLPVSQIVPRLADDGKYIASESTMYRVLRAKRLSAYRAEPKPSKKRQRPLEYVADAPNQVWTWDITYLRAPVRGQFFYMYLIVDVFSRKVVGRAIHDRESADLAAEMIRDAVESENLDVPPLVLHSDNSAPMKGATMLETLRDLGIAASFSRPSVSNDNPFSEALFRTAKYRPDFPTCPFQSLEHAREWGESFHNWYNNEHRHSAIRFVTPAQRHAGLDVEILRKRREVYAKARRRSPQRWSGPTRNWSPIEQVRLNPGRCPKSTNEVAA